MSEKDYNCFSYNQMTFLVEGGSKPVHVMMHSKTKRTFWIFKRTELLHTLLEEWTSRALNHNSIK